MPQLNIWPDVKRAWVLVQVKEGDPGALARSIIGLNAKWRDAYNAVIRADVVTGEHNIVVSVFARNDEQLRYIEGEISAISGENSTTTLRVEQHIPEAPHATQGYISDDEAKMVDPAAGPMGVNAWG
jgi:hypothetical protein